MTPCRTDPPQLCDTTTFRCNNIHASTTTAESRETRDPLCNNNTACVARTVDAAHYTHKAHCCSSLFSSLSAKVLARPKAYSSLPEKIPEGHKRRTIGPEMKRTKQRSRRRRDRRRVSLVTDVYRES
ncbi:hypothetical protein ALC60_12596 [Trachymyrmex zeteki]|uniref:Uncharacterized protein n=1 Tax=Mycetomoellerius zeteki TaxID=64791 RepID=A0A151WK84_9HYME|nr:hypothetical protein ALC60_12596 [Trachymyrmex zeteki]